MPQRSLPVLFPSIPDQRWSCHSCGNCCRTLVGHLTTAERDRILDQDWDEKLGAAPVVQVGHSWMLNKRADGACVFLDDQNRCRIHSEFGEAAKPLACRIFPFSVRPSGSSWQASLRFDCPSVTGNEGAPLGTYRKWLDHLVCDLTEQPPAKETETRLSRRLIAQPDEISAINNKMLDWFGDVSISLCDRMVGAASLIGLLSQARLENVRGERFSDLLDILGQTVRNGSLACYDRPPDPDRGQSRVPTCPAPPTARQLAMLRQAALAHAEHVTLDQLRSGLLGRLAQRWRQLRSAGHLLDGRGDAPTLPGIPRRVAFSKIDLVAPAAEDTARIDHLLQRYLTARIEGQSVFGQGYYGWTVLEGFAALCLSVAVAGWLARYLAAADDAYRIRFSDVSTALGIVDRAATRLPALGTWAERNRIAYLQMDEGLIRLLLAYPMVDPAQE